MSFGGFSLLHELVDRDAGLFAELERKRERWRSRSCLKSGKSRGLEAQTSSGDALLKAVVLAPLPQGMGIFHGGIVAITATAMSSDLLPE